MMLQAGVRLGPYQVVSLIAVGGMGEVYRAHDGRLHRDVAVKVLSGELAKDAPRLLRFEKEALAVSSLSHPNILTLYDVGTFQSMPYMVTELIEGKTLRERLTEGTVPIRKAIDYTLQIAAGLAAAHDKGVIHRDLKPENLLLTPDGRVKILDFGLAKLSPSELPGGVASEAARTSPGDLRTDPAVLMGTPGYMSPEQIQGLPVDARSDIFALGLILYELLYGRRAFARPSVLEMTMAILKEDPHMDSGTERLVPTALQRVIQRCLEKNPQERFHSARDIAYALEAVSAVSDERPMLGPLPRVRPPQLTRRAALALGGAGLLGSYAAAIALGRRLRPAGRCSSPRFRQLTFRRGVIENARFAADGNTVVYGAAWEQTLLSLYEVRTDQPQSRQLYADAHVFALSSSGELAMVRFGSPELPTATLARAPLAGGAPRDVLTGVHATDWSPDGSQLAVICASERKFRLEYPIGRVLFETAGLINQLRVSPDGQRVVFLEHPVMGDTGGVVAMVDVNGRYTVLTRRFNHLVSLAFHPSGREIWFSAAESGLQTSLWAVTLDGEERVLLRGAGALRIHDVSRDGRALISQDKFQCAALVRPRGSREERELSWFDFSRVVDLSADGQTLLFDETGEGGGPRYSTFVRKLDGSPAVRLGEGSALALSPDGRWALAVVPDRTPRMVLWPTGPGQPIWLPGSGLTYQSRGRFTPDSRYVLWSASTPGGAIRYYRQAIEGGGGPPEPLVGEGIEVADVSPSGRWLLTGSLREKTPALRMALYPMEGGPPRPILYDGVQPPDKFDRPLRFGDSETTIYVWRKCGDLRRQPTRIDQVDLLTGKATTLLELRPADLTGFAKILSVTLTADAQVYAYSYLRAAADLYLVEGLQ
jgi:hypothetical protein